MENGSQVLDNYHPLFEFTSEEIIWIFIIFSNNFIPN